MPASDHLGPQLQMFMTARQLHDDIAGDDAGYDSKAAMWSAKRHENLTDLMWGDDQHDVTLHEDISRHGVQQPVDVLHGYARSELWDGHHRVQETYEADPERYLAVEHHDVRYR